MIVEMNSRVTVDRNRSDQNPSEAGCRLSADDIQSLNSWSENLSTSSSDNASRAGSLSPQCGNGRAKAKSSQHRDGKTKSKHIQLKGKNKSEKDRSLTDSPFAATFGSPNNTSYECEVGLPPENKDSQIPHDRLLRSISSTIGGRSSSDSSSIEGFDLLDSVNVAQPPFHEECSDRLLGRQPVNNVSEYCESHNNRKSTNDRTSDFTSMPPLFGKSPDVQLNSHRVQAQSSQGQNFLSLNPSDLRYLEMPSDPNGPIPCFSQPRSSTVSSSPSRNTSQTNQRPKFFDYHRHKTSSSTKPPGQEPSTFRSLFSLGPSAKTSNQSSSRVTFPPDGYHPQGGQSLNRASRGLGVPSSEHSISRLHNSQPSLEHEASRVERLPKSSNDLYSMKYEHRLEPENVKTKIISAWNNIKYGWTFKSKSTMKYDSPLYMLGRIYHRRKDDPYDESENEFLKDFASRIWLTYRSNFYPIPGTKYNTDCGWGCMLRSGQMLIAQCLLTHFLGRDWRLYHMQTETQMAFYREIIRWFSDPIESPSDKSPFCLHHLAHFGRRYNKDPGEWYGPSSVAYIFRDAFVKATDTIPILSQVCLYVAQDCTVYIEDVLNMCTARRKSESVSSSSWDADNSGRQSRRNGSTGSAGSPTSQSLHQRTWLRSLILLIPMRLGGETINEIYSPCVKKLLSQSNCMGIIGGKPRHSLYFLGWQDEKLIYLDPHFCRDAVDISVKDFSIETYHCMSPRKLSISKMDPSCTVGFYIKDLNDFHKFVDEVKEVASPQQARCSYPMFIFSEGSHLEAHQSFTTSGVHREQGRVKVTHYYVDERGQRKRTDTLESEEFIML